jgi:hypothetical protein
MTPFLNGAAQFFTPSHLLAIVALGFLAGRQAPRIPLSTLAAFAIGLVMGSLAVASAIRENPASLALLLLAASAAGLVVIAYDVPRWLASVLAFAGGCALPLNSPPHELTITNAIASQVGLALAALVTFAAAAFVSKLAQAPWRRIAVRIVASWIAASAILVLALRLVR